MLRACVIGLGYWGPNLVRNVMLSPDFELAAVVDTDSSALKAFSRMQPNVGVHENLGTELLQHVDVAFIATPPHTHAQLVTKLLGAGVHVWCEKPFTGSFAEANQIVTRTSAGEVLWIDYPYLFHPAIQRLRDDVNRGEFGDLKYYVSQRGNYGVFHQSASVISDLVVHDLAILQGIYADAPISVQASMHHAVSTGHSALAFCTLTWESGFVAHIVANQLSPVKTRVIHVGGSEWVARMDDNSLTEKLVYGVNEMTAEMVPATNAEPRLGQTWAPYLPSTEALQASFRAFAEAILGPSREAALVTSRIAVRNHVLVEALHDSASRGGVPIEIDQTRWAAVP